MTRCSFPPFPPPRPPQEFLIKDYSELIQNTSEIIGALKVVMPQFQGDDKRLYKALIDFLEHTRNELKKIPPEGSYCKKSS